MSELPIITLVCAITRPQYLDRWFDDLYSTDLKPELTNLCFVIDGEFPKAYEKIMREMNAVKWRSFAIAKNFDHEPHEGSVPLRRKRIAEVHRQMQAMVGGMDGHYLLEIEDDTVFTNLVVRKLYDPFTYCNAGIVSAFQAGRWTRKMVGVWRFDPDTHSPSLATTNLPSEGLERVHAVGFYCYLTTKPMFMAHPFPDPDPKLPWGPDVTFGMWVDRSEYEVMVNWDCPVGHRTEHGIINPMHNIVQERFVLTEIGWERQVLW